jgi:hypothetical protein
MTNIFPDYINRIIEEASIIISSSFNKEFIHHSQNTVQWAGTLCANVETPTVCSLTPKDGAILVASFTHEIERGVGNSLHPHDFQGYSLYKQASHIRSAEIMQELMTRLNTPKEFITEVTTIIKNSITLSDMNEKVSIVREADALSFFSLSLPFFFVHRLSDKVLQDICAWEFKKLSNKSKKHLARLKFNDLRLKYYVNSMFNEQQTVTV